MGKRAGNGLIKKSIEDSRQEEQGHEDGINEFNNLAAEEEQLERLVTSEYNRSINRFTSIAHSEAIKLQKLAEKKCSKKKGNENRPVSPLLYVTLNKNMACMVASIAQKLECGTSTVQDFDRLQPRRPLSH